MITEQEFEHERSLRRNAEDELYALEKILRRVRLYIEYALLSESEGAVKQWFLWQMAFTTDIESLLRIPAELGQEPPSSHPFWQEWSLLRGEPLSDVQSALAQKSREVAIRDVSN